MLPAGREGVSQAGRGWVRQCRNGKYIGVSRKCICYFTPPNFKFEKDKIKILNRSLKFARETKLRLFINEISEIG
jgi:hypothetical protein